MTPPDEQAIGDHLIRLLGEESAFILIFKQAIEERRTYTVSSLPPEAIIVLLEHEIEILRSGRHSDVRVHESSDPA